MAQRSGPIYEFADEADSADFRAAHPDAAPVPVVVIGPDGLAEAGTARWRVEGGSLWVDVDWADEYERHAGDSEPPAYPEFDAAGLLTRVVVDLDLDLDLDLDPDSKSPPESPTPDEPTDPPPAMGGGEADPTQPTEDAEMASDANATDEKQVPLTSPPRKGAPAVTPPDEPADDLSPEALRDELQKAREALKKTNRENAERRRKQDELEQAEEERKAASLSDVEKLKRAQAMAEARAAESDRRAAEAERLNEELKLERLVEAEARKLRFDSPELAYRLIDRSRIARDEETGEWEGVAKAVDKLAKDYPGLLSQKKPGAGSPPRDEHPGNGARRRAGGDDGRAEPPDMIEELRRKVHYPGR